MQVPQPSTGNSQAPPHHPHTESSEREPADLHRNTAPSSPASEFSPNTRGRLFTNDKDIRPNCKVHPAAGLHYDALSESDRKKFDNCNMSLSLHLPLMEVFQYVNQEGDKDEDHVKKLLQRLGYQDFTKPSNRRWQCRSRHCEYKGGTLQHFINHLKKGAHLGLRSFKCEKWSVLCQ